MSTAADDLDSSSPDHADVRRIEAEIEATREELGRTLEALEMKFSPRRRLQAALQTARERGSQLVDRGGELARDAAKVVRRDPLPYVVATVCVVAIFAARMVIRRR
jgi:hypothetical protein